MDGSPHEPGTPREPADRHGSDVAGRARERFPTGWPVTRRWIRLTAAVVVGASLVLALVLVLARG